MAELVRAAKGVVVAEGVSGPYDVIARAITCPVARI